LIGSTPWQPHYAFPGQADFINVDVLAQAVANKIQVQGPTMKRVFDLDEAAAYCGLTRDSFKKKVVRDRLRKVRLDKCWRFDKADLDAWIDCHKDQIPGEAA
jgi:excisionase family DNA binding protein